MYGPGGMPGTGWSRQRWVTPWQWRTRTALGGHFGPGQRADRISRSVHSCTERFLWVGRRGTESVFLGNFSGPTKTGLDRNSAGQYLTPLLSQNFPVNGCRNPSAATGQISSS